MSTLRGRMSGYRSIRWLPWSGIAVALLSSCSGMRFSTEERPLYTGHTIVFTEKPAYDGSGAKLELDELVKPGANNTLLGLRPSVALYNTIKEPKKKNGVRHWLKFKLGTEPVYLDKLPLNDITGAMVNRMVNRGYFEARSSYAVVQKGRTASVVFTVEPGQATTIAAVRMGAAQVNGLDSAMARELVNCPIYPGEPYDLARLTTERERVAERLRDQGWYRMRADDLVWAADTSVGDHKVIVHLRVKQTTTAIKRRAHSIGSVTVHGDQDEVLPPMDTVLVDGINYVSYLDQYRPSTLLRGVFIRPGDNYSLRRTTATQRYLTSYGVFRNVLVNYSEDSIRPEVLHANVSLLPQKRFSLFSEMNAVSKSNNFAGPGIRAGFKDRNLLGGGEQFSLDVNGRFETQVAGADKGTNAYEVGIKAGLAVPRMLLLPEPKGIRNNAPVTNIAAGYGLFRRINLYGLRSAAVGMGYTWRKDRQVWHDLQLVEISYNNLYYTSDEFEEFLAENPTIRRSFEDQFILGVGYTFTRSTRKRDTQRSWFVYSLGIDESANLISLLQGVLRGPRPEEGFTLMGQRYSQYVRLRPELRYYRNTGAKGAQLVTRLLAHSGISYGNTEVMPYIKQFYAGGTNSLRGFRARSMGPGSYVPTDSDNLLVDQVGDIKLEVNLEYRFPISGFIKGAVFTDAGNIWLLNEDTSRPGGELLWDTFLDEIAVSSGFGVRIDPGVIVIRLDLAAPLRRPDLPAGDRWVFDDLDTQWSNNLILNIAIGYPF